MDHAEHWVSPAPWHKDFNDPHTQSKPAKGQNCKEPTLQVSVLATGKSHWSDPSRSGLGVSKGSFCLEEKGQGVTGTKSMLRVSGLQEQGHVSRR